MFCPRFFRFLHLTSPLRSISISQLAYTLLTTQSQNRSSSVHLARWSRWTEIIRTERFYARCAAVTWLRWFYV